MSWFLRIFICLFSNYKTYVTIVELIFGSQIFFAKCDLIDISGCGQNKGCWFVPPACEKIRASSTNGSSSSAVNCDALVTWALVDGQGMFLEIEGRINDVTSSPSTGKYVAVAYSKDDKMGDDSVVDCVAKPDGSVSAYISFNDVTENYRLYEASKFMLQNTSGSIIEGRVTCRTLRLFQIDQSVPNSDVFKIFDLQSQSYVLQIARGKTKPGDDFRLSMHSTLDGPLFPWISSENVAATDKKIISTMKQTDVPRFVQYNLVKVHGIFMIFGWWVFGSIAVLFARFTKSSWPDTKIFGSVVWFQLHRCFMIISVVLQSIAFAFVFIQAGDFKMCSYKCDSDSYTLKLHTILGVTCTSAALLQPFIAWIRPKPTSSRRPIFNWLHWFIGTGAWIIACVNIFLSAPLGKSGLRRNFGYKPDYIMAGYICSFILTSILLEILAAYYYIVEDSKNSATPMMLVNGPKKAMTNLSDNKKRSMQIYQGVLLIFFSVTSLSLCIALSVLIALNHFV